MRKLIYIIFVIFIFLTACDSKMNQLDNDKKASEKIITQLITTHHLLNSNAFLENSSWSPVIDDDFKTMIQDELKIEDINHLNFQLKLFKDFKINPELINAKTIITNDEFNNFVKLTHLVKNEDYSYIDWLEKKNCRYGFSSISKPIFNESYTVALIDFVKFCGPLCGGRMMGIYELEDNKWKLKKTLVYWIA